jgi:hypothetical protein
MKRPKRRAKAGKVRIAIVYDGCMWYVRRIATIEFNLDQRRTIYHCDKPISSDHPTLADVPQVARLLRRASKPRRARRG